MDLIHASDGSLPDDHGDVSVTMGMSEKEMVRSALVGRWKDIALEHMFSFLELNKPEERQEYLLFRTQGFIDCPRDRYHKQAWMAWDSLVGLR